MFVKTLSDEIHEVSCWYFLCAAAAVAAAALNRFWSDECAVLLGDQFRFVSNEVYSFVNGSFGDVDVLVLGGVNLCDYIFVFVFSNVCCVCDSRRYCYFDCFLMRGSACDV